METIKDNWWNRIFYRKTLKAWKDKVHRILGWFPQLEQDLREAKTLSQLLEVHKKAWNLGFQNPNLAPLEWGMFRTKSIPEMTPDEVYLGGIWGLSTKNIPFWEENKSETMAGNGFGIDDDKLIYEIIMSQYRNYLRSNFKSLKEEAKNLLFPKK